MEPYIMIFSKDDPERAVEFSAETVFFVPDDNAYYVRGKDQNVLLLEGDVLVKFKNPADPENVEFYLIGKENFLISEEEKKEHGN